MTSAEYQQLVESLERQFTEIGHRFTGMDRRFDAVGHRFTEMDGRFDEVDLRVTELRQDMLGHFDAIYHRFERLEHEYHAITQALRRLVLPLAAQNCSLTSLRQRLFKTGGRLTRHARYFVLHPAEGSLTGSLFRLILHHIERLAGPTIWVS